MSEEILAPMAGLVLQILVKVGDAVNEDDVVMMLDAMKTTNRILATADGVVKEIRVEVDDEVATDQVLMVLE